MERWIPDPLPTHKRPVGLPREEAERVLASYLPDYTLNHTSYMAKGLVGVNPRLRAINVNTDDPIPAMDLLHEVGHVVRGHIEYGTMLTIPKPQLQRFEREAWEYSRQECQRLGYPFEEEWAAFCLATYITAEGL